MHNAHDQKLVGTSIMIIFSNAAFFLLKCDNANIDKKQIRVRALMI